MFDGNFSLWRQAAKNVVLFTNLNLNRDKKKLDSRVALRYHHNNDQQFHIGLSSFDALNNKAEVLNLTYVQGAEVQKGIRVYGGYQVGFNFRNTTFPTHNFLVAVKNRLYTFMAELALAKNAAGALDHLVELRATGKVNDDFNVMTKFVVEKAKEGGNPIKYDFVGEYNLGDSTKLKAKISSDNSLTLGLLHNYNKLINFGFVSKVGYI